MSDRHISIGTNGTDAASGSVPNGATEAHPKADGPAATGADAHLDTLIVRAQSLAELSQGNIHAVMRSGQVWAAGFEDIYKTFAAAAQAQLDQSLSVWKALSGTKSLGAAIELQSGLARTSFDTAVLETAKVAGATAKLAGDSIEPIATRIAHVMDVSTAARWPRNA